ncbi:hypothetical protein R3P38DRAFT_3095290 [Favolaschia claudopus]|uniref:F-box domain-containing protein n=1 Tax=Favolaschia claudopus TaxID=2862362 RepID=A0AAV9ZQR0_9AGAR
MLFIRSTAKAISLKSIIAWLPNECLYIIMEYLATPNLAAMCRTSRLLRNMGTKMLYRDVTIGSEVQLELFLKGLWSGVKGKRSPVRLIRSFVLGKSAVRGRLTEAQEKKLAAILCKMSALEFIRLEPHRMDYNTLLGKARFPALIKFQAYLRTKTAVAMIDFLNRHAATVESVIVITPYPMELPPEMQRIRLPALRVLSTRSYLLDVFDLTDMPLTKIMFLTHELDAETPAESFVNVRGVSTLQNVTVLSDGDTGERGELLRIIAANLAHIQGLTFAEMKGKMAPISHDDANNVAAALEKFHALEVLDFGNAVGNPFVTVLRWGNVCKSLQTIRLNGVTYKRRETDCYTRLNSDAEDDE